LERVRQNRQSDRLFQSTGFPLQAIHELVDLLRDDLERQTERSHSVPVETQVLTAL